MRVSVLRLARQDIKEARDYLSYIGESPPGTFRASFEKFVSQVSDMPYMFSQWEHDPSYRRAVIAFDYLVFYRVDEKEGVINVHRVLHGKRNLADILT